LLEELLLDELQIVFKWIAHQRNGHLLLVTSAFANGVLDTVGQRKATQLRDGDSFREGSLISRGAGFNYGVRELSALAVLDVVSEGTGVVAVPLDLSISGITEAFTAEVEYDLLLLVTDTFKMLLVGKCCTLRRLLTLAAEL
jgi:hypothetical protein